MAKTLDPKKIEEERKKKIERYTTTVVEMGIYYNFLYFMGGLFLLIAVMIFFSDGLTKFWTLLTLIVLCFLFAGGGFIWMFYDKEQRRKQIEKDSA